MLLGNWFTTMTNSKISLINNRDQVIQVLTCFLEGRLGLFDLAKTLSDHIVFDFKLGTEYREITKNELQGKFEIPVRSRNLQNMLLKFIADEVTKQELSDWAAFIYLSRVYIPEGNSDDEKFVAGEGPVWDILQRLITPEIFDGMDKDIANKYLNWLTK